MTEPIVNAIPPSAVEFAVRVEWAVSNKSAGIAYRYKNHKILALSLLEAISIGLDRHKANICTFVSAGRTL